MLRKGFYQNSSTENASALAASYRGPLPIDPRGCFALSNELPWRRPCLLAHYQYFRIYNKIQSRMERSAEQVKERESCLRLISVSCFNAFTLIRIVFRHCGMLFRQRFCDKIDFVYS